MPSILSLPPIIYNLFPSLLGEVTKWRSHAERASEMGFNWLFLNPIHLTGASGSLYAIRDYFKLSPIFFPYDSFSTQKAHLRDFVLYCRDIGVEVMVDLVINHTAYDNPLTIDRRNWYKLNHDGSIKSPGTRDDKAPGGYVVWGDLSEIDNEYSTDRKSLWDYWWSLIEMYLSCEVRGFRCDAAYQVPNDLWRLLIERTKSKYPETKFFAESLGCSFDQTVGLSKIGHDYVFNSGKWWNYRDNWFLDQLQGGAGQLKSICFPESHDTDRLANEWNNDVDRVKQHYFFSALISSGVLTLLGFEYGFRKKPHVVSTNPYDYEGANYDLTDYIRTVNFLKLNHRVFSEDNKVERLDSGNSDVLVLRKSTFDNQESGLLIFNLTDRDQEFNVLDLFNRLHLPSYQIDEDFGLKIPNNVTTLKLRRYGSVALRIY